MNRSAPIEIVNARTERGLLIRWSASEQQQLSYERLRALCPCAQCRANRLRGQIALVDAAVAVKSINLFHYGVQLVFSDGHDRGIYPWQYLYEQLGRFQE